MAPDLSTLKTISKENLSRSLRLLRGKKILVIDPKLTPTFDLFSNFQFLKDRGVEKVYQLESQGNHPQPPSSINQILYFISSDLISAKLVSDQINNNLAKGVNYDYGVVVVPRLLHIIKGLFESEGVYGHITFGQYSYELIPLDDHILSLQYEDFFQNLILHRDTSYLATIAKALFNLRGIYGEFNHIIGIGAYSQSVMRMMEEFEKIHGVKNLNRPEPDIPTLIIFDRSEDFLSTLLTPLTYEGMLDEVFGIKGKTISFPPEVTGSKESVKQVLNSSDSVFEKVRNLHFSRVVPKLVSMANELKSRKDETAGLNVKGIKNFVENDMNRIKNAQKSLTLHFGAIEAIIQEKSLELKTQLDLEVNILDNSGFTETKNYLEDAMARGFDHINILRLFCLLCLANDGLKEYKSLTTQFIQSYGFKHLITIRNLEKMGLLYPYKGIEGVKGVLSRAANATSFSTVPQNVHQNKDIKKTTSFQNVIKKLVPPVNFEVNVDIPNHSSYIFNGAYSPFIAKLTEEILQILIQPNTNSTLIEKKLDDLMKYYQITENTVKCKTSASNEPYLRGRNALVFIIGGISRSEIASLQIVAQQRGFFIISGGTNITNGKKVMFSAIPNDIS